MNDETCGSGLKKHLIGLEAWTIGFICGVCFIWPTSSFASENIRVALADTATRVVISSSHPITLRFPSGPRVIESKSLVVKSERGGLNINGRRLAFKKVFVRGSRGHLALSVQSSVPGGSPRRTTRKWLLNGRVEIQQQQAKLLVINEVDVETYVAGVVTGEINTSWHAEALKAQAVAARTYVLYKKMMNQQQPYDVVSSVQDQVFQGQGQVNAKVEAAIRSTRGQVITYDRHPILAAYSSTAAGPTEDASYVWNVDVPYLKGVECPFDDLSPRYRWRAAVSLETLERQFRKLDYPVGTIATITPFSLTPSGRIDRIRILHSQGQLILRGQDFRRVAGYSTILSTQFQIEHMGRELVLVGKGSGHGVGLCQWGMKEMAELGYSHEAIVRYYYPGTELSALSQVNLSPPLLH
ncbi:SpoIID/LytB domain-containing protein [Candidatus Nitrospira salsa]